MFARRVYMHLRPASVEELTQRMEKEVIPLLRKQKGFQDEIMFIAPGGKDAFGISLWETAEHAEAYNRNTYPEVTKILSRVVEGTPQIKTFEVSNSTFHKVGAPVAA
jgi:heme-degrading monooxygenase HmoA